MAGRTEIQGCPTVEEASRRFDLSPTDEELLLQHFRDGVRSSDDSSA